MHPFHLAFPVSSLESARAFYGNLLGCPEGRSSDAWIDFNLYGHQIVAHLAPDEVGHRRTSEVDGDDVPVRHFGVVLSMEEWESLAGRLRSGVVWINAYNLTPVEMPFGGVKASGVGRENGRAAVEHYTRVKSVYVGMGPVEAPF